MVFLTVSQLTVTDTLEDNFWDNCFVTTLGPYVRPFETLQETQDYENFIYYKNFETLQETEDCENFIHYKNLCVCLFYMKFYLKMDRTFKKNKKIRELTGGSIHRGPVRFWGNGAACPFTDA